MGKLASHRPRFEKLKLIDPAGNDIGVTLHVVGKDSKEYQSALLNKAEKHESNKELSAREAMAHGADIVCSLVVGFEPAEAFDSPDFKPELKSLLLSGEFNWVAELVNECASKRELFYKGSQSNSASA